MQSRIKPFLPPDLRALLSAMDNSSSPDARVAPILDSLPLLPPPAQEAIIHMEEMMFKATERLEKIEDQVSAMQARIHTFPQHLIGGIIDDSLGLGQPLSAQEVFVDMEKKMDQATERLGSQFSMKPTRIHRFPHNLRMIGGPDDRYVVPSVVAIGPYHRGLPHLEEMEEIKHAMAFQFCRDSGRDVKEVYEKILSIVDDIRRCYTVNDGKLISDAMFATMMFLDGCFLLQLMGKYNEPPIVGRILSSSPSIYKDIFLLENQIPLLVLEALMKFMPVGDDVVGDFIAHQMELYFIDRKEKKTSTVERTFKINKEDPNPPHLLGLLRFSLTRDMPYQNREGVRTSRTSQCQSSSSSSIWHCPVGLLSFNMTWGMRPEHGQGMFIPRSVLRLSAVHLAQIGVKLTTSTAGWFPDMHFKRKHVSGELSMFPLILCDVVACDLVNMAALEVAEATYATSNKDGDGYVISSYLSLLAMLMDREEDVHALRGKGLLCSRFKSLGQHLTFFKSLGQHLRLGHNYFDVMSEINKYMRKRPVRIAVHKFVYNNYKVIAAVLSIAGVLVGIFQALYSLKEP